MTLNEDSSGNPGTALCTLTDPGTFSASGVHAFAAPTTGTLCPTLTASTTYFAVIERVVNPVSPPSISLNVTTNAGEDSGGAMGWSIGNTSHWYTTFWNSTGFQSHQIEVKGLTVPTNAAPVFSADTAARTLPENSGAGVNVVGGVVTATDIDSGDTLTYSLTGTDAGSFEIDSNGQIATKTGVTHTFNFEGTKTSYSVTVNVSDSKDIAGAADTVIDDTIAVTINLTNVDEAGTVTLPSTFTGGIAATASVSDPDGTVSGASWQWARGDTATGSFSNISGATSASYTPVDADVDKYLRATVTYKDAQSTTDNKTASAVSSSTVGASNSEPTFDDGTSTTRSFPENSGTGTNVGPPVAATDSDADTLTYSLTGNTRFNINASTGQIRTASGQSWNYEGTGNFQVTVTVRDSKDAAGAADTVIDDTIMVTINLTNVNEAPTITTSATTASVAENSTAVLTLAASDVDASDTKTWSVESTGDGGKFAITSSGALSFSNAPNFEMPTDVGDTAGNNTYVVTVKVTDAGGLTDTHMITVTVTNVNEAPEIMTDSGISSAFDVAENTATSVVIKTFEATDVDASTSLTWSLEGDDAGDFTITKNSQGHGELKFRSVPDFENPADAGANNEYDLTVRVRDNGSPRMDDTIVVTVTVTDVNEAPEITTTATTASAAENSNAVVLTLAATDVDASDTREWSVESADDGPLFTINQTTGALSFTNAPDFEMPDQSGSTDNRHMVTVKVTDAGGLSDTHTVTVTVTNVNEAPEITTVSTTYTDFDFDENTATSEVIKTYEAADVDADTTLTWSLEGNDAGDFTITKNAAGHGELKFANEPNFEDPVDADTMNDYDIRVKVKDNGIPSNRGSSNQLDDTVSAVVNVLDVNEAPVITGDMGPSFEEIEYDATSPDLTIGTYTYTDEDRNPADTITWGLNSNYPDPAAFTINANTGVLSFNLRPDFENPVDDGANNDYDIEVQADDGEGGIGTFVVIVTVTNVDETPEITTTAASHTAPSFMEIEYDAASVDLTVADYDGRDEEGQTISWSRTGTDSGDFTIDANTGVLAFAQRPNYEMPADAPESAETEGDNIYHITVRARDTASPANTRDLEVVVTVTDVNERPDITENFNPPQTYVEIEYDFTGTRPDIHTFTATDYDDQDTFAWSLLGTDAAHLDIDATSGILTFRQDSGFGQGPLPNFEHPRDDDAGDGSSNTYSITVRATDDDATDQKSTDYSVVVTVTNVNEQPSFTGTPDVALTPDEHDANTDYVVMDLADYDAQDEEGGVTWSLTGTDSGDFDISTDGVVTFAQMPNYEDPDDSNDNNAYTFTVVATDEQSGSGRRNVSTAVTVTVGDVEEAGTLTVDNLSPGVGDTLTFELTDPDGGIDLTLDSNLDPQISWGIESQAIGGSWVAVPGVVSPRSTTFTYTVDEDETGKALRGVVTYIDRRGPGKTATSEETAAATADPIANAPPRFRGGSTWSVEEGPAGKNVGSPISASDRDNDTLTYGIESSQDSSLFEINPSTGQVRTVAALDFETTSGFLTFVVTLHDGRDADGNAETNPVIDDTRTALVTVTDVEEDGVITLSAAEAETGTPLTATLEDGDGGVTGETWQWARSQNGRTNWTNISGATSSSYTPTEADEDFYLRATVTYTDRRGAGKSTEGITGRRVPSQNRRPVFPSTETGQRTVPENTRAGVNIGAPVAADDPENDRLTYTLTGTDAAAFTIVGRTGQLRASEALDFETKPSYSVTVEVHDGRDGMGNTSTAIDDTQAVTITVENVEEPGVVTLTTDTGIIQARVEVTAALDDDDIPSGVTWQWSRSPNGRTDWVNIAGATSATYTPTLGEDEGNYLRATASYTDGHGPNKTANTVSPRVADPPPVNSAPVFPSTENGRREVAEDTAPGDPIGDPVVATDLNAGDSAVNDPLAHSLTGTDAGSFTIDAGTGQIRLASGVELDFEGKRTHRFTVQVTDGRDQNGDDDMDAIDDTITVTVTVTNVNEAPVVTGDAAPSFQENANSAVATYTAADPERDTLTWSVDNDTEFWISDRGQLYFRTPPNFEVQTSYSVTVTATDDDETANLPGSLAVSVTVTDAEEEGTITIEPLRGWDGTMFRTVLDDDDGGITGTTWQWERSPNGRSGWTAIGGATTDSYTATADDANRYLRAGASYEDRRGSGKEAFAAVTGRIEDSTDRPISNNAPEFTEDDDDTDTGRTTTRMVSAGTAGGRNVGSPVRATDPDQGDVLTYSLSGTDAVLFDINPTTGQVLTKAVLDYDPDGTITYSLQVRVHDGFGPDYQSTDVNVDATIEVTITVTAVRRPPPPSGGGGGSPPPPPAPEPSDCTDDLGTLSETVTRSGSWADDYESDETGRGYARYYSFTLDQEAEVTIDLTSSVDTYLYLREGDANSGESLHENNDIESGNTDSRIVATLAAGAYTVEAAANDTGTTGDFTLSVSVAEPPVEPPQPEPPADPCVTPLGTLAAATTQSGTWTDDCESTNRSGRYARFYSFTLEQETEVTIDLTSETDTYLFLLTGAGQDGTVEEENDDAESGTTNSRIVVTLAAGTYTVEATTYSVGATGDYTLTITGPGGTDTPGPTPPTPTDSCVTPLGTLMGTVTQTGTWAGDCESTNREGRYARFYTFTLAQETAVTIDLASETDTYLFLLAGAGKDGTVEEENDDIESGNTNSQVVDTLAAGTYTIEATTYNADATGDYTLTITGPGGTDTPGPTPPTPTDSCVVDLGSLTGTVSQSGTWADDCASSNREGRYARFYSFTLEQETEVTIDLTSETDTYLFLLAGAGKDGTVEEENDDIESGNTNSQVVDTLAAGTYTIEATTYNADATGDYTLTITGPGGTDTPAPTDSCVVDLGSLTGTVSQSGTWADDCASSNREGRYARFYSFTLEQETEVTIDLTSETDTYLFLLAGAGKDGTVEEENDDIESGNTNSRVVDTLAAGTYTIEATTYNADATGDFTLNINAIGRFHRHGRMEIGNAERPDLVGKVLDPQRLRVADGPEVATGLGPEGDVRSRGVLSAVFRTLEMRIPPWYWFSLTRVRKNPQCP